MKKRKNENQPTDPAQVEQPDMEAPTAAAVPDSQAETPEPETPEPETEKAPSELPPTTTPPASETTDSGSAGTPAPPDIEALIAEAENRGYMRGRNESIEALMQRPGMLEHRDDGRATPNAAESEPMILGNRRPSIWDRG